MDGSTSVGSVMAELEALGNLHARNSYKRHGAEGPMFGLRIAELNRLAKRYGPDQALARGLWATGNLDARLFAAKLADPKTITRATLDAWAGACAFYMLVDVFVADCAAKTPQAEALAQSWRESEAEYVGRAGWTVVAHLARQRSVPDELFAACLRELGGELHAAPNRKREAMNTALIAIGGHREALRDRALTVADALGEVEIDHGQTGCVTPDARAYIEKMRVYAEGRTSKGRKRKVARS